ncbi:glycoside hydrolase family 99-like domain-containing protein [Gluconobacter sp. Dm-62]|uniref:glycosyltransferase WbsX family protein n=1 Tax=Gluconobacter sp. Dm-62 TaxID=2799804 RepID=UPI001B8CB314|nr:glycoside hydrolase family 99-like domain-containing protein [Gluconobacter sp. Dm-62]MBS1103230.1 glycoside hydrolase family 99-like domain-containing protein [Gluconobacter sp. Dm-62]
MSAEVRNIAFYLPQFHRIPENDEWWGEGFTEWTNVRKAKPLFKGHVQPIVPGELGYYDLLDEQVYAAQAQMARTHGIEGFCYWHYWFGNGKRILEKPFNKVLETGKPDFPFCLCWANQSWTGVWHGAPGRVLMEQTYNGDEDMRAHFAFLTEAFRDPRYITFNGRPVFPIYGVRDLPDPPAYIMALRNLAVEHGFPGLHIIGMANSGADKLLTCCDQVMPFGPGDYLEHRPLGLISRVLRRLACTSQADWLPDSLRKAMNAPIHHPFRDVVDQAFKDLPASPAYIPCITTGWDNTPRSKRRGVVFEGYSPELLGEYVRKAVLRNRQVGSDNFIFFKAWNEWAEGNVLEPETRFGLKPLEAVAAALKG